VTTDTGPADPARRGRARLHWESTGDGPPVLLIAGLGQSANAWWRTVPALAGHRRVLTFDNRGVGRSSRLGWLYTTAEMADDAAAVLDAAGVAAAHVYGLSLGGMAAQQLALRHPERVASLVLGATHGGGARVVRADAETIAFFRRRSRLPAEEAAWAAVPYNYGARCRREHAQRIADDIAQRLRFPPSATTLRVQLSAGVLHDCCAHLHQIAVPTLVVHGDEDRMVPVRNAELLAEAIPGARLHVLRGVGHLYPTEAPEVDEAIAAFLAAVDSG
jgi:pimeloyl-ACP methyl ester carboxylesterase